MQVRLLLISFQSPFNKPFPSFEIKIKGNGVKEAKEKEKRLFVPRKIKKNSKRIIASLNHAQ